MKGAFTCPYCMTQNACDCEACKPFIKEGEPVNKWDETGEFHICGKCGLSYSPDQSLNAEFKLITGLYVTKPFIVANVREIIDQFDRNEISFSRMVEMFNEKAAEFYKQEVAKEREKYDKLYSEFEEVCRQVQINKDKCVRYEEAYHKEREKANKLVEALDVIYKNTQDKLIYDIAKQSLTEYEKL